jgi:two-component system sensor histidine kinase VicK
MTFSSDCTLADTEEKTEVIYDEEEIKNSPLKLFSVARSTLNNCIDSVGPSILVTTSLANAIHAMKDRGIRIRFITEITKEGINYCKELMQCGELLWIFGYNYCDSQ